MNINDLQRLVTMIASLCTLVTVLYSAFKVVNRNQREWELREERMRAGEIAVTALQTDVKVLIAVNVQITELKTEIERMRTRLDRFLDASRND